MAALQGLYPALVIDNQDPEQLARVLVRVQGMTDPTRDVWARLVTMMAGADRGTFFVPEIGDEVLVAFEREDERAAYVLGGMWSGKDRPPAEAGAPSDVKLIRSRSGVRLRIVDAGSKHGVTIDTPAGQRLTLQDDPNTLQIEDADGNRVTLSAAGITVDAAGPVRVNAALVEINAGMLTVHAPAARFDGVVQCDTLVSNSVVSASYTPGAGNLW